MIEGTKVIAFDADDTLWSNEPLFREAERKVADQLSDFGDFQYISDELYKVEFKNMEDYGFGAKAYILSMVENAIKISGGKVTAGQISFILDSGREILHNPATPFPGVIDTLSSLHQKGYTLTIASSRSRNSLTELTHDIGIADYISYMIGADDVKEAKPKPEPVLKTLDALQFEANEALVVGDMVVDIMMGANAGTRTCGVTWGNGSKKELQETGADYIIESMEELVDIMCLGMQ